MNKKSYSGFSSWKRWDGEASGKYDALFAAFFCREPARYGVAQFAVRRV
jgi:hypothetical protein